MGGIEFTYWGEFGVIDLHQGSGGSISGKRQ